MIKHITLLILTFGLGSAALAQTINCSVVSHPGEVVQLNLESGVKNIFYMPSANFATLIYDSSNLIRGEFFADSCWVDEKKYENGVYTINSSCSAKQLDGSSFNIDFNLKFHRQLGGSLRYWKADGSVVAVEINSCVGA